MSELSEDGKDQIALALILLKDYKVQGVNPEEGFQRTLAVMGIAKHLGVHENFEKLLSKLPVFEITPKS